MSAEQQEETRAPARQANGQEKRATKSSTNQRSRQTKRQSQDSGADEQSQDQEQAISPLQMASLDLVASLKDTFTELGKTVRDLLETVQSLLKSVGALLKVIATALSEGLQRIGLPMGGDDSGGGLGMVLHMVWDALLSFGKSIQERLGGGDEEAQPSEAGS